MVDWSENSNSSSGVVTPSEDDTVCVESKAAVGRGRDKTLSRDVRADLGSDDRGEEDGERV